MEIDLVSFEDVPAAVEMLVLPICNDDLPDVNKLPYSGHLNLLLRGALPQILAIHNGPASGKEPFVIPVAPAESIHGLAARFVTILPYSSPPQGATSTEFWNDGQREIFRAIGRKIYKIASRHGAETVGVISKPLLDRFPWTDALYQLILGIELSGYSFTKYSAKSGSQFRLSQLYVLGENAQWEESHELAVAQSRLLAASVNLARDIILTPPNDKHPPALVRYLRDQFYSMDQVRVDVLNRDALWNLGAGGILAVGSGSVCFLVKLTYRPVATCSAPMVALVGKGITMDTGGYCLKPAQGQAAMKYDCAGLAAVVGALKMAAQIGIPLNLTAYLPITANLVDTNSMLTSEVIRMLNGSTVEVVNTDAEGRLILADAITMACRDGATTVIDIATLTGVVALALGTSYGALFSNDETLATDLLNAGNKTGDLLWRLPLVSAYKRELQGGIADLRNVGGGNAGSIVAALFLQHFVSPDVKWAHLDIAGTARVGLEKGVVPGFGVSILVEYLQQLAARGDS